MQRAARALARHFDDALRPLGLTNGQFSILMSLNRVDSPTIGSVAALLTMDSTTLTANLKPLERRGLLRLTIDAKDRRIRRPKLTPEGRALLISAVRIWKRKHTEVERLLGAASAGRLRADLRALSWAQSIPASA